MKDYEKIIYTGSPELSEEEMIKISGEFFTEMSKRRTVRDFSERDVPFEVIENAVKAAGSAPSGANQQPWHFVIVKDKKVKREIKEAAEAEEADFYEQKAPDEWLEALAPLGTDKFKPFLEKAPYLIVLFEERYGIDEEGKNVKHYYTKESIGIACGMLISALHLSGVATLTHTPSPMNFLNKILDRPSNEKPFLILVAGYPQKDCKVPKISKKKFDDISSIV